MTKVVVAKRDVGFYPHCFALGRLLACQASYSLKPFIQNGINLFKSADSPNATC